ncbi:MAG: hypothetical protein P1P90_03540 [Patescibacteria group bacterium]|nr:hypothetical protein [Patescibacteria group bacterium]
MSIITFYLLSLLAWLSLVFLAIINGSIRNYIYEPIVGNLAAHQISSVFFILVIFLVSYLFLLFTKPNFPSYHLLIIGLIWLLLTLAFEFLFGHFVAGHSWAKLFADYNILKGRIWSLVIITTLIAPFIINKFIFKK